jgi:hypothetical protein
MTTPVDTEGVSGNAGAAPLGSGRFASNADTSTPGGAGGGATGLTPNPNTAMSGTPDTSGAGQGQSATFTPVSTLLSGTLDTQSMGWPQTSGVTQAYRAPNTTIGVINGATGALDTTRTDTPISDGSTRTDVMSIYTGTLDSNYIGAPTGPVGTGIPVAPGSAPTVVAGPGQVTINWASAVADPSNAPVRGYVVMSSTGGTAFAGRGDRTVVFDTVTPNQAYTFRLAARNDNGVGPFSAASASVTPYNPEEPDVGKPGGIWAYNAINPIYKPDGTVVSGSGLAGTPGAPTSPVLTQGATGVLNCTWVAPAGGKVKSYTVTLSTGQTKSVSSATLTTSFTGLTPTTSTTLRVTAVGTVGSTQSVASPAVLVP